MNKTTAVPLALVALLMSSSLLSADTSAERLDESADVLKAMDAPDQGIAQDLLKGELCGDCSRRKEGGFYRGSKVRQGFHRLPEAQQ